MYPSDIKAAEAKRKSKYEVMAADIKAARATGRGSTTRPGAPKRPAVIDKKTIQNHRAHMKRLDLQGESLAERTFKEITSHPSSLFADYKVEWSKAKVKRRYGRVSVRDTGQLTGADHKDTADLVVERWNRGKVRKAVIDKRGLSLKNISDQSR